ncbi:MAG: HTH domain-containing protein, partial [Bacteroidales bacterium]
MTIKEAIIQTLEDLNKPLNYMEIFNHIMEKDYYPDFKVKKTPENTVSAHLTGFIKNGDSRIKRIKETGGSFLYYLTRNEANIEIESIIPFTIQENRKIAKKQESYEERDLHKLLSSFLKTTEIFTKTIFHEQSNRTDEHQKWIHPDIVGIKFLKLQTNASQTFLKAINRVDTFKISSYEIKKEINSDYELKKSFFQAVSNSSWANYGYLVAFEISDNLNVEMERLNQSFGIGIIELKSNPYESKILFQSKYKDLDFKTIDKLCKINKEFERFIEQTEKLMTASDKYVKATEKELDEFCDKYFLNDTE